MQYLISSAIGALLAVTVFLIFKVDKLGIQIQEQKVLLDATIEVQRKLVSDAVSKLRP